MVTGKLVRVLDLSEEGLAADPLYRVALGGTNEQDTVRTVRRSPFAHFKALLVVACHRLLEIANGVVAKVGQPPDVLYGNPAALLNWEAQLVGGMPENLGEEVR